MKRFVIAAVLVAALGLSAGAQQPDPPPNTSTGVTAPPLPPLAPPVAVQPSVVAPPLGASAPNVFVPPGTPPGPAIPFYKSGGVVVGVYGYYPYDTGAWLLGGTDGTTRQSGAFTMVFPETAGVVVGGSRGSYFHGRGCATCPGPFRR